MLRFALGALLLLVCCRGQTAAPSGGELEVAGKDGTLSFRLELDPDPPPLGELFRVRTRVVDVRSGEPVTGAAFSLDASMPHHSHGMVTRPEHRELGDGWYLSEGLRLHMPGKWTLQVSAEQRGRGDFAELVYEQLSGSLR
jgi:hypothetical protein